MSRPLGPTRRWLLVPLLLIVALLAGVRSLETSRDRPPDPALRVEVPPLSPGVAESPTCLRDDAEQAATLRARLREGGRVTSAAVVACPQAFDGALVSYVGEVVGDLLARDGGAWVQVNDDAYALELGPLPTHDGFRGTNASLSVWLPDATREALTGLGRPDQRGDVVEVVGRLHRADPEDGGGMTLRAERLRVLAPSVALERAVDPHQLLAAIGVSLAAGVLFVLRRRAARR